MQTTEAAGTTEDVVERRSKSIGDAWFGVIGLAAEKKAELSKQVRTPTPRP
jgi:hypothetical protein